MPPISLWTGRYKPNPPINTTDRGSGLTVSEQRLLSGNAYATAVRLVANADGSCTVYQSTKGRLPAEQSATSAVAAVTSATATGLESLRRTHRAWWHAYYPSGGFVSLGDTRLESFYW